MSRISSGTSQAGRVGVDPTTSSDLSLSRNWRNTKVYVQVCAEPASGPFQEVAPDCVASRDLGGIPQPPGDLALMAHSFLEILAVTRLPRPWHANPICRGCGEYQYGTEALCLVKDHQPGASRVTITAKATALGHHQMARDKPTVLMFCSSLSKSSDRRKLSHVQ